MTQSTLLALATAALVATGSTLVAAPSASAGEASLARYFDRTFREVMNAAMEGD